MAGRGQRGPSTPASPNAVGVRRGASPRSSMPPVARGHVEMTTGPAKPWLGREARGFLRFIVHEWLGAIVLGFLGLGGTLASKETIGNFFRAHPVAIAPCALALLSVIEVLAWRRLRHRWSWLAKEGALAVALLATTAASSTAVLTSVPLAAVHPAWCPGWLCPPPPLPAALGSFDGNLEARFTAYHTQAFVVADDATPDSPDRPSSYSEGAVNAELLGDGPASFSVLIHLRNLTDSREALVIEPVTVKVVSSHPLSTSPRVVEPYDPVDFDINAMDATYAGTVAGSELPSQFSSLPADYQFELVAGESDEFALRIRSSGPADPRVTVAIPYRFAGDPKETLHTLDMTTPFHVLFEDSDHWNPYRDAGGVYVPAPPDGGT